MKQVTDTSKAKIVEWFMKLHGTEWENIKNKYTLPDVGNITDEQIEHIYLSEHPQPTDTGDTVSSEVGLDEQVKELKETIAALEERNGKLVEALKWIDMKSYCNTHWEDMQGINNTAKEALQANKPK